MDTIPELTLAELDDIHGGAAAAPAACAIKPDGACASCGSN
jgi:hypothetical protein